MRKIAMIVAIILTCSIFIAFIGLSLFTVKTNVKNENKVRIEVNNGSQKTITYTSKPGTITVTSWTWLPLMQFSKYQELFTDEVELDFD